MTSRILVPIDFSGCSGDVLRRALELARARAAEVVLMHAVQVPSGLEEADVQPRGSETRRAAVSYLADEAREALSKLAEELVPHGVKAKQVVTVGAPAEQILRLAEQERASSIVMGTHGRRGVARLLLGSVAHRVSQEASCPVEVVAPQWKPSCSAASCNWCASGGTEADDQIQAERDG